MATDNPFFIAFAFAVLMACAAILFPSLARNTYIEYRKTFGITIDPQSPGLSNRAIKVHALLYLIFIGVAFYFVVSRLQ